VPLHRLYVLAPLTDPTQATGVTIRTCSARERLLELVTFTFHLDVGHAGRIRDAFELAGDVIATHEVRRVTFPWNLTGTDVVTDAILADLGH
jgi:hypothetical protein